MESSPSEETRFRTPRGSNPVEPAPSRVRGPALSVVHASSGIVSGEERRTYPSTRTPRGTRHSERGAGTPFAGRMRPVRSYLLRIGRRASSAASHLRIASMTKVELMPSPRQSRSTRKQAYQAEPLVLRPSRRSPRLEPPKSAHN
jgi:hypothetical protein